MVPALLLGRRGRKAACLQLPTATVHVGEQVRSRGIGINHKVHAGWRWGAGDGHHVGTAGPEVAVEGDRRDRHLPAQVPWDSDPVLPCLAWHPSQPLSTLAEEQQSWFPVPAMRPKSPPYWWAPTLEGCLGSWVCPEGVVLATLPCPWLVCGAAGHLFPNFTLRRLTM